MHYFSVMDKMNAIKDAQMRIENYKELIQCTFCPVHKLRIEEELVKDIELILNLIEEINKAMETDYLKNINRQTKEFTPFELAEYDGRSGRPAYVAVDGIVYDVSLEATWGGASHFGLEAGKDLSAKFNSCHSNTSILSKLKKVGELKQGRYKDEQQ